MTDPTLEAGARHLVSAEAADAGERLDRLIAARLPALSRSRVKALIEAGQVSDGASGATITDPSRRVKPGQAFAVAVPAARDSVPEAQEMALEIVYEDDDLVVLNKPAGMVVHPAPGNPDRTLVNALLAHCGDGLQGIGGVKRPGIVHRLDKDTSGLMVVAKNDLAHASLSKQFAERTIERLYRAVVWGVPRPAAGVIDGPIGRDPRNRKRMAVVTKGGKPARTRYRVVRRLAGGHASLVECKLETGRTHQIRVHMAKAGHPVIGDPLYAGRHGRPRKELADAAKTLSRQALHAGILGFLHPRTGKSLHIEQRNPHDFNALISSLEEVKDKI